MWPLGRPPQAQGPCCLNLLRTNPRPVSQTLAGSGLWQVEYFTQNVFVEWGKLGTQVPEFKIQLCLLLVV